VSTFDVRAIQEALADQIRSGVSSEFNVTAFPSLERTPPYIEVVPASGNFYMTEGAGGRGSLVGEIHVVIDGSNAQTVFQRMAAVLSIGSDFPDSIAQAVMADQTLGGIVDSCTTLTFDWDGGVEATIPYEIIATKTGAN
jgi:hypothetical protein